MNIEKIHMDKEPSIKKGYILPIKDSPLEIIQGYNGFYSHFAFKYGKMVYDHRFAVDFKLPLNTSVYASKEGIVRVVQDSIENYYTGLEAEEGMIKYPPNKIMIAHDDGTYSVYSHLRKNSALVSPDEKVKKGQKIAETGLSGWIGTVPHLHFTISDLFFLKTFPVEFEGCKKELFYKD